MSEQFKDQGGVATMDPSHLTRCENWKSYLFKILEDFHKQTKSKRAAFIIENFDQEISKFVHVVPDEVIDKLSFPIKEKYKIA